MPPRLAMLIQRALQFGRWFRPHDRDVHDEIQAHIHMAIQDRVAAGEDPATARREVLREFGGLARTVEDTRAVWRWQWVDETLADVRYALRTLRRSRGFAAAAILSLAIGTGATVSLLSVLHHVTLRPLPYGEPERLAIAWNLDPRVTPPTSPASFPDWQDWRASTHSFQSIAAFRNRPGFLVLGDRTYQLELHEVSADYLPSLGVAPALGRMWSEQEGEAGQAAVISDALWRDAFGGARGAIGRRIVVSQSPYVIVGVMPPEFAGPSMGMRASIRLSPSHSIWTPLVVRPAQRNNRGNRGLRMLARIKPGATLQDASKDLAAVAGRLAEAYPESNRGITTDLAPLAESITGAVRTPLAALTAAAGLFLLIACANVASLLIARDAARRNEFATRFALGAGRWRLVRQSLTESVVLALAGGAAGVGLAAIMLRLARGAAGVLDVPRLAEAALDAPAMAAALAICGLTALLFGLTPALRISTITDRRSTANRESVRLRQALTGAVTAVTVVLLCSGILLVASARNLMAGRTSAPERTHTFQVTLSGTSWARAPFDQQFYDSLLTRLRALPQVETAAFTTALLNVGDSSGSLVSLAGAPPAPPDRQPIAGYTMASGDFFRLAGLSLREGRLFDAHDRSGAPLVAIVNEAFVRAVSPDQPVVGRTVKMLGVGAGPMEIVGVVADDRPFRPGEQERPRLFYPYSQVPSTRFIGMLRMQEGAASPIPEVRRILRAMDPSLPLFEVQSVAAIVGKASAGARWGSTLVAVFAAMALLLCIAGVAGTVGYCASLRRKECGIRLALGAVPPSLVWMIARQGLMAVLAGGAAGLAVTVALRPLLAHYLFGVAPGDPMAVALCLLVLSCTSALAAFVPARQAATLDPAATLRTD